MGTELLGKDQIFNAAAELIDPSQRARYLDEACAHDPQLRAEIDDLLERDAQAARFLESLPPGLEATIDRPAVTEKPGAVIGPYKLLQQIGEGGMGVVFMAEQSHPLQRTVAVKIIKPGMDTRQVIARFEAERQAVAMMDHPNIAKVLDAGTTDSGRPYFVMELVKGVPITRYCDEKHLPLRARLELFMQVCQAVQHAHQKGIIHRDIKPNNVLVAEYDNHAVPKVIDFGVAKAVAQKLTERTMFTEFGQVLGTMEYMSPEQSKFNQLDIDTRSDIYSLGVLLYELLAGSTPFEGKRLHEAAFDEMLRIIREEEPPKPSTRLSTTDQLPSIAANRGSEPKKLGGLVRGELDWIAMKALEKDRNRRFETASGLAADIQRYLDDEPVQACPPSPVYRLRKFARRNKRVLTTVALLGVMLLAAVGTVAGSLGWMSRGRAARQMVVEQTVFRALEEADELHKQRKWQEALAAVERAQAALAGGEGGAEVQQQVTDQLADLHLIRRLEECRTQRADILDNERQCEIYARLFTDIGIEMESLTPPDAAARILRRPGTAVEVAAALDDWALVLRDCGFRDETRDPAAWKRLLEVARLADPDPWRGELRQLMGRDDLNALQKLADGSDIAALPVQSLQLMASALILGGDAPACIAWLRKAHRQHPGDALIAFELAFHLSNLPAPEWAEILRFAEAALAARPSPGMYHFVGFALSNSGRHEEAAVDYRKAIELRPDYALAHWSLGNALRDQRRLDDAIAVYRKLIELTPEDASGYSGLGVALSEKDLLDEAIAAHRRAIALKPDSAWAHIHLGYSLSRKGRHDDAIAAGRTAIELQPDLANAHERLGDAFSQNGQLDEAINAFGKAVELKPDFMTAITSLGNVLRESGRLDDAIAAYRKAIDLKPNDASVHSSLAHALRDQGRLEDAIAAYRKAIDLQPEDTWHHSHLGVALSDSGRQDEAIAAHRKAVELKPDSAWAHIHLVYSLIRKGWHEEAIVAARSAIELEPDLADTYACLGTALSKNGRLEEAIIAYGKAIELKPNFALAHGGLAYALSKDGRLDEAIAAYDKAITLEREASLLQNNFAWLLVTGPDPKFVDPKRAVELAKKAVEMQPQNRNHWNTLGAAHYRAGDWPAAVEALEKSMALRKGGDSFDWFFLAMTHWQLEKKAEARTWYDQAVEWMEKNQPQNEELKRFRKEAAELLGVTMSQK